MIITLLREFWRKAIGGKENEISHTGCLVMKCCTAWAKRVICPVRPGSSKLFGTWAKMLSAIFNRAKSCKHGKHCIYYIKLQKSLSVCLPAVCLSVPPPFFSTRPSDRNQTWHTYSGRYGNHSQLKKIDPAHPRGNITSYVTSSNVEYVRHLKTTARRSMT